MPYDSLHCNSDTKHCSRSSPNHCSSGCRSNRHFSLQCNQVNQVPRGLVNNLSVYAHTTARPPAIATFTSCPDALLPLQLFLTQGSFLTGGSEVIVLIAPKNRDPFQNRCNMYVCPTATIPENVAAELRHASVSLYSLLFLSS